jgi:hypothetical protein
MFYHILTIEMLIISADKEAMMDNENALGLQIKQYQ